MTGLWEFRFVVFWVSSVRFFSCVFFSQVFSVRICLLILFSLVFSVRFFGRLERSGFGLY